MPCDAIREAWLAARYAQQVPAENVREHIAGCAECTAFTGAQTKLDAVLALVDSANPADPGQSTVPSLGFDTRFFARLEAEKRAAARRQQRRWWLWLGPASLAAVLALAWFAQRAGPTAPSTPRVAAQLAATDEVALMRDLELVEALPVVQKLDEIEAYETLAQVDDADLVAVMNESKP